MLIQKTRKVKTIWSFCFIIDLNQRKVINLSSYYELVWREDELEDYPTDKLNFIFNTINHPLPMRYRQYYPNRLEWQKAVNNHDALVKRVKDLILSRDDIHQIRDAWRKQHDQDAASQDGYTAEQLANKLPHLANQLGAIMEIENIEIKYFDDDLKPRYDLDDFKDIFAENCTQNGFLKNGMTKEGWLKLYPQISEAELDQLLARTGYEPERENDTNVIPYWYAVGAKRVLIDGDDPEEAFD